MPEALHKRLEEEAKKKGLHGKQKDAYVFGTLNRIEKAQKEKHKPGSVSKKTK